MAHLNLSVLPGIYAVGRGPATMDLPERPEGATFWSLTATGDEVSVVVDQELLEGGFQAERDWAGLKVQGPLDFGLVGILASLLGPLAKAEVPVFVISTFDTDYLFVRRHWLDQVQEVLVSHGHQVIR